jgi:hypothetical protein
VFRVKTVTREKWHNIEKARRVLGYEPIVGLDEGIRRTVDVRLTFFFSRSLLKTDILPFCAGLCPMGGGQP